MSWINRLESRKLTIITGNGETFEPLFKASTRDIDWNVTAYEYVDISGVDAQRGKPKSYSYDFQIIFQGENNIDERDRFINALAEDSRPITVKHPYYDDFIGQIATTKENNTQHNISVISGTIIETILDNYPSSEIDLKEQIAYLTEISAEASAQSFADNLGSPSSTTLNSLNTQVTQQSTKGKLAAVTDFDFQTIQDISNETLAEISNISETPIDFARKSITLVRTPAKFYDTIQNRFKTLTETYSDLLIAINPLNKQSKIYFESAGSAVMMAKCEAAVNTIQDIAEVQDQETTENEYKTAKSVIRTIDDINTSYQAFIEKLGDLQTENASTPDSYTPDQRTIQNLVNVLYETTARLYEIAIGAKKERIYTLTKRESLIVICHRLYGNVDEETLQEFIENNDLQLNERLLLDKGRTIKYYI